MTLRLTDWLITSDITPETARYTGSGWVLSWLPGRLLTREQAMTGMVLDETLSDPDPEDYVLAMEIAAIRAADLGLELARAVVLLHARIVERDRRQAGATCRIAVPTTPAA